MQKDKIELLAPVSSLESLQAAISGGCDAVYFGTKKLNMRITANNFELQQISKIVAICHQNNVKAYLTLNTICYEDELDTVKDIIKTAKEAKIDAIIAWDMAVIQEVLRSGIDLHISTQASVSNSESAKFYQNLGAKRIILARECTLEQIKKIKAKTSIELECFVHGAMCVSVSGRCFLSHYLFNKSANRGDCLQPCRRGYIAYDPEEHHKLFVGTNYLLSPKDLCALPFIDKLMDAGITCFKIEGRRRSPEYVQTVTKAYRQAIGLCCQKKLSPEHIGKLIAELKTVYNRGFSSGFFMGLPNGEDFTDSYGSCATRQKEYVGFIRNFYQKIGVAEVRIESGKIAVGDEILIIGPTTGVHTQKITSIQIEHSQVNEAHKGQRVAIKIDKTARIKDKMFLLSSSDSKQ